MAQAKNKGSKRSGSSHRAKNVEAVHLRGEEEKGKFDFVVSRAVMPLPDLVKIVRKTSLPVSVMLCPMVLSV